MLEAMLVTLREGVEVALVVGVLLAYLRKTGRPRLARHVLVGLGAAILTSLAGAVAVQRYGFQAENEVLEGTLMLLAAGLVGSLALWMWRTGHRLRQRLERRLDAAAAAPGRRAALGVFAFAFFMVLREGVETVLFLVALAGTSGATPLSSALGGGLGLLLAGAFGYLLVQGTMRVNLRRFFAVTGAVLAILVAKLIARGLHEFFEAGLIRSSPFWVGLVELLAGKAASLVVLILLVALPVFGAAWDHWSRHARAPDLPSPERPDAPASRPSALHVPGHSWDDGRGSRNTVRASTPPGP